MDLQHVMAWCMRSIQSRAAPGGDLGIETFRFGAEVQRIVEVTIHAKDSRSLDGCITGIAGDGTVFTRVSTDQKLCKRSSTYWIVISSSLTLTCEA